MSTTSIGSTEQCNRLIINARKMMYNRSTTEEQYKSMQKTLALMYLYCPEKMQKLILSTLDESYQQEYKLKKMWAARKLLVEI